MMIISKDMEWIKDFEVKRSDSHNFIIHGQLAATNCEFIVTYRGDGGNADEIEVQLFDGQYETNNKPLVISITGCWELHEVTDVFILIRSVLELKYD